MNKGEEEDLPNSIILFTINRVQGEKPNGSNEPVIVSPWAQGKSWEIKHDQVAQPINPMKIDQDVRKKGEGIMIT